MLLCIAAALIAIAPWPTKGVIVQGIDPDSPLAGKLQPGDILSWANELEINSPQDLLAFENFTGTFRFIRNGKLALAEIQEPGLGIVVVKPPLSRVNLGMDLVGGTRVLLKPVENVTPGIIEQTISTLATRINIYGLREARFQPVTDVAGELYVQIEMAGGSREEIEGLLARQGRFEGRIPKLISFTDAAGSLRIGDDNFTVNLVDTQSIEIEGRVFAVNESFELGGVDWQLANVSKDSAVVIATVFTGADIRSVCTHEQPGICVSRVARTERGWQFMFQAFVTSEGAERFAAVTDGMRVIVDPATGESYLESKIALLLDEKLISELNIAADLAGKAYTEPLITGFRESKEAALREKLLLQSVLSSGALPVKLEIVRVDQVSASLGYGFLTSAMIAGAIAAVVIFFIVWIRYRSVKIAFPVVLTALAEAIMILGVAAMIRWTIDLAALVGIIAVIGTGVDAQIMIVDELRLGGQRIYTLKQRIKRAFFIIFGAAATLIAAMLPLMFIGIGIMRGFAITTTLGVLIGVLITRPAFGRIAEKVLES